MGLTRNASEKDIYNDIEKIKDINDTGTIVALAGNPNVGKTTLFNTLTGLNQHTGNWTGKTVKTAIGKYKYKDKSYTFVDLPGTYSINSLSPEETVSRDFLNSQIADYTIVVCDASALERNLTLALQIIEMTENVIVCVNLLDEAKKNNIEIDLQKLSELLNVKVIGTVGHSKKSRDIVLENLTENETELPFSPIITYPDYIERIINILSEQYTDTPKQNRKNALTALETADNAISGHTLENIRDDILFTVSEKAKEIAEKCVRKTAYNDKELKADKFLTGKFWGFATMFALLMVVFWITIVGANYPSELLNNLFSSLERPIYNFLRALHISETICNMLVFGVYHILTKIISVMLPPMAIFFPVFALLEDVGYLPRIAFNLDRCFKNCSACGKQALTTCMGFGCNAAGVVGSRIIDSPRERLISILTNSFIPCNGRFPAIISIITMFFISQNSGITDGFISAAILTLFIIFAISMSLIASKLLSKTLLKGYPSSFILELPHYRKPRVLHVIIRSMLDRVLFVLGRAIVVAAPAGLIIWIMANTQINDLSILDYIANFFDPLGRLMGLDGIIITAFIFGFPANEIVLPLMFMMYTSTGTLIELTDVYSLKEILVSNGWTYVTAINTILFMLMHWPCSTTCLTIKAETQSKKWTLVSILLPTLFGIITCIIVNLIFK